MRFSTCQDYGEAGESAIAAWFRRKGYCVLPVYEKIIDNGKGPRLFVSEGSIIAPDLLIFGQGKAMWIEAKHKTAFSWHRVTGQWVTGIDLRHYEDYCRVEDETPWPVWLLFLHDGGQAKDSPPESPSGLFGNRLCRLRKTEHHRHRNWGSSGMVYWGVDALRFLAPLEEMATGQSSREPDTASLPGAWTVTGRV